jgi:hypothetical protein
VVDSYRFFLSDKPTIPAATSRKELHFSKQQNHAKQMILAFEMFYIPI